MKKFSSGLHKDVQTIFDGVWNPAVDNNQKPIEQPARKSVASVGMQSKGVNNRPKQIKSGGFFSACKEVPGFIFGSRSRRERKRLMAISKHLMINLPD